MSRTAVSRFVIATIALSVMGCATSSGTRAERQSDAAPSPTPAQAYDTFTRLKDASRRFMYRHDPPTVADCDDALPLASSALDYLARPDVRALVRDDGHRLRDSHSDIDVDLATCAAIAGNHDRALDLLDRAFASIDSSSAYTLVLADPLFVNLRSEPRFLALVARGKRIEGFWNAPAIGTPFKERLTSEERIAGLSLFWSEVRQNFAYVDRIDLDWNAVYMTFLMRVLAVDRTEEYYRVMMELAPLLRDGHTDIDPPAELRARFDARPPIETVRIQGKVLVTAVRDAAVSARVAVGDEITAVDGVPVDRYANERVRPFVSASTAQGLEAGMYTDRLLAGDERRAVRIRFRTASGEDTEFEARRSLHDDVDRSRTDFRMIGDVAYLSVTSFATDAAVKTLTAHMSEVTQSKGLIIDVRSNGGGNSAFGDALLSRLSREPVPRGTSTMRSEPGLMRAWNGPFFRWIDSPGSPPFSSTNAPIFDGPVALLIGPQTFSAAEDFAMSFDAMRRGELYGSPTAGSSGQPLMIALPGGGSGRVCVRRETYPDGREFVGVGVIPTVQVERSIGDLRAGRDVVLDRAVADLDAAR